MKRLSVLCCAALLLSNTYLSAQEVIEPEDIPSEGGTILSFLVAEDMIDGIDVEPGAAGGNRMWDFTGFEFDETVFDTLYDPEEAPSIEDFPDANRVIVSDHSDLGFNQSAGFQYEAVTDSGWFMLGATFSFLEFDFPIVYPEPPLILPMPAEFEDEWDIVVDFTYGMIAPDTLMEGVLDSIYITLALGGFTEIDGWGTVRFSGGEVPALRQHIITGGELGIIGVMTLFGQRIEVPVLEYDLDATHAYRWFAPDLGEIAYMVSMIGEENPEFELASEVRVRCILPDLVLQQETLSFGEVRVGNAGVAGITIGNQGEGMGIITGVTIPENLSQELETITELPVDIETDAETEIRFLWMPQQECTLEGEAIELFHNDPELDNPLILDLYGVTSGYESADMTPGTPTGFTLGQNYPNPFNSQTFIPFNLPTSGMVSFEVFDLAGRSVYRIENQVFESGLHIFRFGLDEEPPGAYIYRLTTGATSRIKTMQYIR